MSGLSWAFMQVGTPAKKTRQSAAGSDSFLSIDQLLPDVPGVPVTVMTAVEILFRSLFHTRKLRVTGTYNRRQRHLALSNLIPGFVHCAQQRRPVFEVGRKDLFDHPPRKIGHEPIEHDR